MSSDTGRLCRLENVARAFWRRYSGGSCGKCDGSAANDAEESNSRDCCNCHGFRCVMTYRQALRDQLNHLASSVVDARDNNLFFQEFSVYASTLRKERLTRETKERWIGKPKTELRAFRTWRASAARQRQHNQHAEARRRRFAAAEQTMAAARHKRRQLLRRCRCL